MLLPPHCDTRNTGRFFECLRNLSAGLEGQHPGFTGGPGPGSRSEPPVAAPERALPREQDRRIVGSTYPGI
jgi:hypothetical protein